MAFSQYSLPASLLMQQQPQLFTPAGIDPNVEIVRLALKILCFKQRPLSFMELQSELCNQSAGWFIDSQFISTLSIFQLNGILNGYPDHFALVRISPHQTAVKPQTRIELCKTHCSKNGYCPGRPNVACNGLHICKFYILDSCKIENCKFGHDLMTHHNMQIRRDYLLDHLRIKELKYLLNLAENRSETTVPRICKFYNNEGGCRYQQQGKSCPHLHICRHYIMDKCNFGPRCKRNHDIFVHDVKEILTRYKINISRTPKEIIAELQEALSKDEDSKSETCEVLDQRFKTASSLVSKRCKSTPNLAMQKASLSPKQGSSVTVTDSDEGSSVDSDGIPGGARIKSSRSGKHRSRSKKKNTPDRQLSVDSTQETHICLYNLRGRCSFKDSCRNVHKNMPYQWQIRYQSDGVWKDVREQDNLNVEFNYCNPECDYCSCKDRDGYNIRIFFEKMKAKAIDKKNLEVRRLSTVSSEDAENQPLATRWCWFWQDQRGKWVEYGSKNVTGYQKNVRDVIEQRYLANPKGQCQFATLGHKYIMDFSMMTQQNMETKTNRRVKRRPEHVSPQEAKKRKLQPVQSGALASQRVPGAGIGVKPCIVPSTWNVQHGQDLIDIFSRVEVWKKFIREEYQKSFKNVTGYQTNVVSDVIEQRYLANPKGQCQFPMMTQQNMETKTNRRVKRRPEHVSPQEAKKRKLQPVESGALASQRVPGAGIGVESCIVPSTWKVQHGQDLIDIFNRVEVKKKFNREEYQKVETLFLESMPSTTSIISVERIENGELWSNYHNKKDKMQRKNPGLKELYLFHGTQSQYIDAICRQGFDFRLSGRTTGTLYGKGSYFAKTAKFADSYTECGSCRIVFLVRIVAGDYTLGDKTYTRPPLKDPKDPCSDLYDSCVNDVKNPEIFVIFDNYQVYPEYMIKYNMNYTCI